MLARCSLFLALAFVTAVASTTPRPAANVRYYVTEADCKAGKNQQSLKTLVPGGCYPSIRLVYDGKKTVEKPDTTTTPVPDWKGDKIMSIKVAIGWSQCSSPVTFSAYADGKCSRPVLNGTTAVTVTRPALGTKVHPCKKSDDFKDLQNNKLWESVQCVTTAAKQGACKNNDAIQKEANTGKKNCMVLKEGPGCYAAFRKGSKNADAAEILCKTPDWTFSKSVCSSQCAGTAVDPTAQKCKSGTDPKTKKYMLCPGDSDCSHSNNVCKKVGDVQYVCSNSSIPGKGHACVDPKTKQVPLQWVETQEGLRKFCTTSCARLVGKNLVNAYSQEEKADFKSKCTKDAGNMRKKLADLGSLCSKNAKGDYCHALISAFKKLPSATAADSKGCWLTPDQIKSLKGMGCCVGSAMVDDAIRQKKAPPPPPPPTVMITDKYYVTEADCKSGKNVKFTEKKGPGKCYPSTKLTLHANGKAYSSFDATNMIKAVMYAPIGKQACSSRFTATLYADLTCKTKFTQGGHNSTQTMPAPGYKLKACERSSHFQDLNGTRLWKSSLCTQIDPKIHRNPITAAKKCGVAINTKPCKGGYMASTAIESTVKLKGISAAQFGESEKAAFVAGVAKTAGVVETQVNILSVKDSARRASGVEVTSSITVAAATSADAEKLSAKINTALKDTTSLQKNIQASSTGTSLSGTTTSASMAKTTSTSSGIAASSSSSSTDVGMIAGVVVAVVVVVAVLIVGGYFCSQKKKSSSNDGVTVKVDDQGRI